jgi:hypothetical protein
MLNVMKRNALRILSALIIASALIGSVSVHQGRTDTNGGHTDNSTGEYHYHHGYPDHDHYDMDGDGDEDCPYDFKDKTGSSSGSSGYSSGSSSNYKTSTPTQKTETIVKTVTEEVPYIPGWAYILFGAVGIIAIVLAGCLADEKKARKQEQLRHENEIAEIKKQTESILRNRLGKDWLNEVTGAPKGHSTDENGLPICNPTPQRPWGVVYTYYKGRTVYHTSYCRHAAGSLPANAYTLRGVSECKVCKPTLPNMDWVPQYNRLKRLTDSKADKNK